MGLEVKGDAFLKQIALQYSGQHLKKKKIRKILNGAITSLPDKRSKLKKYLEKFFDESVKKMLEYLKEINKQRLNSSFMNLVQKIQLLESKSSYVAEIKEAILGLFEECDSLKTRITFAKKLCTVTIAKKLPDILHCAADCFYNVFEKTVEDMITNQETGSQSLLKTTLINLFTFLHSNYAESEQGHHSQHVPAFSDIIAAVYSLILDLTILDDSSSSNEDECISKGKQLLETGIVLLGKHQSKLLDSLLQVSASQLSNADLILMPLFQYILLKQSWTSKNLDEEKYLQYIMASLQGISLLQSHRPRVCESIRTTALQASAPPDFYKWISERSGGLALLDETPLMESTTPLNVTRTLMTECDMQIMDQFLDVCARCEIDEEGEESVDFMEETKETLQQKPSELLFVLDAKPKQATVDSIVQSISKIETPLSDEGSGDDSDEELLKQTNYLLDSDSEVAPNEEETNQSYDDTYGDSSEPSDVMIQSKAKKPQKLKKKKVASLKYASMEHTSTSSTPEESEKPHSSFDKLKKTKKKAGQQETTKTSRSKDILLKSRKKTKKLGTGTVEMNEELSTTSKKLQKLLQVSSKADIPLKATAKKQESPKMLEATKKKEKASEKLVEEPSTEARAIVEDEQLPKKQKKLTVKSAKKVAEISKMDLFSPEEPNISDKPMASLVAGEKTSLVKKLSKRKMDQTDFDNASTVVPQKKAKKKKKKNLSVQEEHETTMKQGRSFEKENEEPVFFNNGSLIESSATKKKPKEKKKRKLKSESPGLREKKAKKRKILLGVLNETEVQESAISSKGNISEKTPAERKEKIISGVKKCKDGEQKLSPTKVKSKEPVSTPKSSHISKKLKTNKKTPKPSTDDDSMATENNGIKRSSKMKSSTKNLSQKKLKQSLMMETKRSESSVEVLSAEEKTFSSGLSSHSELLSLSVGLSDCINVAIAESTLHSDNSDIESMEMNERLNEKAKELHLTSPREIALEEKELPKNSGKKKLPPAKDIKAPVSSAKKSEHNKPAFPESSAAETPSKSASPGLSKSSKKKKKRKTIESINNLLETCKQSTDVISSMQKNGAAASQPTGVTPKAKESVTENEPSSDDVILEKYQTNIEIIASPILPSKTQTSPLKKPALSAKAVIQQNSDDSAVLKSSEFISKSTVLTESLTMSTFATTPTPKKSPSKSLKMGTSEKLSLRPEQSSQKKVGRSKRLSEKAKESSSYDTISSLNSLETEASKETVIVPASEDDTEADRSIGLLCDPNLSPGTSPKVIDELMSEQRIQPPRGNILPPEIAIVNTEAQQNVLDSSISEKSLPESMGGNDKLESKSSTIFSERDQGDRSSSDETTTGRNSSMKLQSRKSVFSEEDYSKESGGKSLLLEKSNKTLPKSPEKTPEAKSSEQEIESVKSVKSSKKIIKKLKKSPKKTPKNTNISSESSSTGTSSATKHTSSENELSLSSATLGTTSSTILGSPSKALQRNLISELEDIVDESVSSSNSSLKSQTKRSKEDLPSLVENAQQLSPAKTVISEESVFSEESLGLVVSDTGNVSEITSDAEKSLVLVISDTENDMVDSNKKSSKKAIRDKDKELLADKSYEINLSPATGNRNGSKTTVDDSKASSQTASLSTAATDATIKTPETEELHDSSISSNHSSIYLTARDSVLEGACAVTLAEHSPESTIVISPGKEKGAENDSASELDKDKSSSNVESNALLTSSKTLKVVVSKDSELILSQSIDVSDPKIGQELVQSPKNCTNENLDGEASKQLSEDLGKENNDYVTSPTSEGSEFVPLRCSLSVRKPRSVVLESTSQSNNDSEKEISSITIKTTLTPRRSTRVRKSYGTAESRIRNDSESSSQSNANETSPRVLRRSARSRAKAENRGRSDSELSGHSDVDHQGSKEGEKGSTLTPIAEGKVLATRRSARVRQPLIKVEYGEKSDSESSVDSSSGYILRRSTRLSQNRSPLKGRSDSESSTTSHGYRTRSRK